MSTASCNRLSQQFGGLEVVATSTYILRMGVVLSCKFVVTVISTLCIHSLMSLTTVSSKAVFVTGYPVLATSTTYRANLSSSFFDKIVGRPILHTTGLIPFTLNPLMNTLSFISPLHPLITLP